MSNIGRRDFLKFVGAGGIGAGAGFLYAESVKKTVEFLVPQVVPPEEWSPGVATWYNTVCKQCSAGCGISVRIREGRAKKIEGNPAHPVSQGRLCALGQSGLNALYNPDRIRTPLRLVGERGTGEYEEISWDEAMTTLSGRLAVLKISERADRVQMLTTTIRGHLDVLFASFMRELGSQRYLQYDFTYPHNLHAANKLCFGTDVMPYYDIRNTDYLLSFGADFLGMWLSPVHHSLAYGHMRQGREGHRGTCVQVEPRMSLSGAGADRWIQAKSGSEGLLALAIAHAMVSGGGYSGADRGEWADALAGYRPESVAEQTGVEAETIREIAEAFAGAGRSLAIGGGLAADGANGVGTLVAVNVLNHLVGALGQEGGVLFNPDPVSGQGNHRQASYRHMLELADEMKSGDVEVLLVVGTNPVFNLPPSAGFQDAMSQVEFTVAMSSFMDETTAMADLVLPTDVYLESWGDDVPEPGIGLPVATISQPVVSRIFDTRSPGDIILDLAHQIGGELPAVLPWTTMEEYVRHAWREIFMQAQEGATDADFDDFWMRALRSGVWARNRRHAQPTSGLSPAVLSTARATPPAFEGSETDFPFVLHPYVTQTFLDGRGANLPWQQELPDPLTSIVYNTWVELNPQTAAELGLTEGDIVEIRSTQGALTAPVFVYQAIRPDVVAMPIGQGHRLFGRFATGKGVNPIELLAPVTDATSGALATAATRVSISKTGERVSLVKTDGLTRDLGRQILGPGKQHG